MVSPDKNWIEKSVDPSRINASSIDTQIANTCAPSRDGAQVMARSAAPIAFMPAPPVRARHPCATMPVPARTSGDPMARHPYVTMPARIPLPIARRPFIAVARGWNCFVARRWRRNANFDNNLRGSRLGIANTGQREADACNKGQLAGHADHGCPLQFKSSRVRRLAVRKTQSYLALLTLLLSLVQESAQINLRFRGSPAVLSPL
jgi:hypothetical protein